MQLETENQKRQTKHVHVDERKVMLYLRSICIIFLIKINFVNACKFHLYQRYRTNDNINRWEEYHKSTTPSSPKPPLESQIQWDFKPCREKQLYTSSRHRSSSHFAITFRTIASCAVILCMHALQNQQVGQVKERYPIFRCQNKLIPH